MHVIVQADDIELSRSGTSSNEQNNSEAGKWEWPPRHKVVAFRRSGALMEEMACSIDEGPLSLVYSKKPTRVNSQTISSMSDRSASASLIDTPPVYA